MRRLALALWALPLGWAAWLAHDVWDAQKLADPAWIAGRVDAVEAWKADRHEPVVLAPPQPGTKRVWIWGSSSVAAPSHDAFTTPLVRHLRAAGHEVVVDNLGWEGMPSWDELARAHDAWAEADRLGVKPDAIVFYGEHNDVTYTFHAALELPHFDAIVGLAWVLTGEAFREHDSGNTYWFYGHRRAPVLLRQLQELGLLTVRSADYQPLVDRSVRTFRENLGAIVATATARGVPIVLVTPIGNYEAEPFGPLADVTEVWQRALAEPDPHARLAGLMAARDAETFTSDLRVKSDHLEVIRAFGPPAGAGPAPVSVCDVEAAWIAGGLPFGGDRFLDPLHFSERGYDDLTRVVATCLTEGPLAGAVVPSP